MQVSAISHYWPADRPSERQIGQLGKEEFLQLLLAQLRNQDPLRPMEDTEFVAQLAQFSSLERVQQLDERIALLLEMERLGQANALIGKQIEALTPAAGETVKGVVTGVKMADGDALLAVGGEWVKLRNVISVADSDANQLAAASSLIGKEVEARIAETGQTVKGIVDAVKMLDGDPVLVIGDSSVGLGEVVSVAGVDG